MSVELSIVIPVYNEAENLPELIRRTRASVGKLGVVWELVLVDDGSTDGSKAIIERAAAEPDSPVVGVWQCPNAGQHAAVMRGFAASRGKSVVTLDADLQNPPEEIPRIYAELMKGADVVGTIRCRRQDTAFRRFASFLANRLLRLLSGRTVLSDCGSMLCGYTRSVVDCLLARKGAPRFIPVQAAKCARRVTEIEVAHASRTAGESKYGVIRLVRLEIDLLLTVFGE